MPIDQLSLDRYRPMFRLLSAGDIEFMRACPGSTPRLVRKLRERRARILREYLRSLAADFREICQETRALIVSSPYDRPALAITLLRGQLDFARNMAAVRIRLALYRFGMARVELGSLLYQFDAARLHLRELVPSAG
jgi:hypothetical protein